jgi:hypothetical protein
VRAGLTIRGSRRAVRRVLRACPGFGIRRPALDRFPDPTDGTWPPPLAGTPPDPELVDAAYRLLREQADMVRASVMFGEDLPVPAGAGVKLQPLAFIGRRGLSHTATDIAAFPAPTIVDPTSSKDECRLLTRMCARDLLSVVAAPYVLRVKLR